MFWIKFQLILSQAITSIDNLNMIRFQRGINPRDGLTPGIRNGREGKQLWILNYIQARGRQKINNYKKEYE